MSLGHITDTLNHQFFSNRLVRSQYRTAHTICMHIVFGSYRPGIKPKIFLISSKHLKQHMTIQRSTLFRLDAEFVNKDLCNAQRRNFKTFNLKKNLRSY